MKTPVLFVAELATSLLVLLGVVVSSVAAAQPPILRTVWTTNAIPANVVLPGTNYFSGASNTFTGPVYADDIRTATLNVTGTVSADQMNVAVLVFTNLQNGAGVVLTPSLGTILYGDGANWSVLPSTTVPGSVLGTTAAGGVEWQNVHNRLLLEDEFEGIVQAADLNWTYSSAAGTWGYGSLNGTNRQTVHSLGIDAATATSTYGVHLGNTTFVLGGGEVDCVWSVYLTSVSDANDIFTIRVGTFQYHATAPTDGIFFRYDYATNGGAWTFVTKSNALETTNTVGATVAASTWYKLRYTLNAAGDTAVGYVNNVAIATNSTYIPISRSVAPGAIMMQRTGGASPGTKQINYDYFRLYKRFTR